MMRLETLGFSITPETDSKNMLNIALAPRLEVLMAKAKGLDGAKKLLSHELPRRFKLKDGKGQWWGIMNPALMSFQSAWNITPVVRIKPIEIFPEEEISPDAKSSRENW